MELPVVRGRGLGGREGGGDPPVAIVNEAMARRVWPAGNALGADVQVQYFDRHTETRQVVGILRDTRSAGSDLKARAEIYMPFAQSVAPSMSLIVRASNPAPPRLAAQVPSALYALH